jgi:predicted nucleotidyltransferase
VVAKSVLPSALNSRSLTRTSGNPLPATDQLPALYFSTPDPQDESGQRSHAQFHASNRLPADAVYSWTVGVSRSKEPDAERAAVIAQGGCILRALVGSTVHGLTNPGTDDRDEMGVCIEPPEYVVGLRPFEHWVFRTQPEGVPSGPGDLDLTIYGLRKYCRMALKGSPTALLLLFVDGEYVLRREPLGSELQALAPAFVSRRAGRAFLGYVDSQRRGLLGKRHATRTRELSHEHGYDTKYAMHALRIAHQGHELLTTSRISLPISEPERSNLMQVRRGEIRLSEVLDRLHERSGRLERAVLDSDLPEEPDYDRVDGFLVDAYQRAWDNRAAS